MLKAFEDLGYYAVDNLPIGLASEVRRAGQGFRACAARGAGDRHSRGPAIWRSFPAIFQKLRRRVPATLVFLEADDAHACCGASARRAVRIRWASIRRCRKSLRTERERLAPIRNVADHIINTSKFNVHELREVIEDKFRDGREESSIRIDITSFGYRHGVPPDSDLVFDVRFLPNPNYIPEFKKLTGRHPSVARYIRSFPQTVEFIDRISELLVYLIPHYIREGKSYLTIAFGCTGGPSPLGDDRERDPQAAAARRVQGERDAPRHRRGDPLLKSPSSSICRGGTVGCW